MPRMICVWVLIAMLLSSCTSQPSSQTQPSVVPSPGVALADTPTAPPTTVPPTASPVPPSATATATPTDPPATATATLPPTEDTTTLPVAEPTASPQSQAPQADEPARIQINAIDLDWQIVSVGLDSQRVPIVPNHDVGWYNLSARPGEGENIVLWGHVLRFRSTPNTPAPFAKLKQLDPGASVILIDQRGTKHRYVVTEQILVTPDQVEYILPRGKEMVTMVSCIGDKVIDNGEVVDMSHRLITIAEPETANP